MADWREGGERVGVGWEGERVGKITNGKITNALGLA